MTHTTTIVARPQGPARPEAVGAHYVVNAIINVTAFTAGGEVINASELGLSTITSVEITGRETLTALPHVELSTAGAYASSSSVQIVFVDNTFTEVSGGADVGTVRVRVSGMI